MLYTLCLSGLVLCTAVIAVELAIGLTALRRVGLQLHVTLRQLNRLLPKCDRLLIEAQHGTDEARALIARVRRLVGGLETVVASARAAATAAQAQWHRVARPIASAVAAWRGTGNSGRSRDATAYGAQRHKRSGGT